ncbi:MAG: PAS domain S-box protein [Planctomycetota bacterium]
MPEDGGRAEAVFADFDLRVLDRLDGLPSPTVRAIEIGADGSLWLGTFGGLCRYDGREFRLFSSFEADGLESDRIAALHLDGTGALWIGTSMGPVSRYRDGRFEVFAPVEALASVGTILEDSTGTIWLCGDRIGRVRGDELTIFELGGAPLQAHCNGALEVGVGDILFATDGGVFLGSGDADAWTEFELVHATTDPTTPLAGLFRDGRGGVWSTAFGADSTRVFGGEPVSIGPPLGRIHGQRELSPHRNLISTDSGLFVVTDAQDGLVDLASVELADLPRAIVATDDGTIWIGDEARGLLRLRPRGFDFARLLEDGGVGATLDVGGGGRDALLVSQRDGRVVLIDPSEPSLNVRVVTASGATGFTIFGGAVDGEGRHWIATAVGVGPLVDDRIEIPRPLAVPAGGIARASDGTLWASIDRVFREIVTADGTFGRAMPTAPVNPVGATEWPGGFATALADVVVAFDVETLRANEIVRIDGAEIRGLFSAADGTLWITTYGDGLFRYRDGDLARWTTREGLPDVFLGWIGRAVGAPDKLWINGNRGAICASVDSLERVAAGLDEIVDCRLVPMSEGNGVTGAALADGRIALPTVGGLSLVDPARLSPVTPRPRLVVDEVRVEGERRRTDERIAGVVDVEVEFRGILFPDARALRYEYRLEGHDADWIDAKRQRVARYTNLPPGAYSFRLRARAPDGRWTEAERPVPLAIHPRWHQRGGVRALGVIGLLGLVALAWLARTRSILRRSRELEQEVDRRRRVETELRASRADHLSVLEAAHGGIVTVDASGIVTYANPACSDLYGLSHDEIVESHVSILGVEALERAVEEVLRLDPSEIVGRWETAESRVERADGKSFDAEFSVARQSTSSEPTAVCVVRDVSERKRMTDELRRSEERYRTLFHTAPAAIVVWREDLSIVDWNEQAEALFGWRRTEAVGEPFEGLFGLESAKHPILAAAMEALRRTTEQSVVYDTRLRSGAERVCSWRFTPLVNPDGSLRAVISMATDLTEEHRVERDLDRLRKRLARAEETERSRIARELHDDLSQRLAALALDMQVAVDALDRMNGGDPRATFSSIQDGLQTLSTDVHALSRQLHPTVLDDLGLSRALRSECARRDRGTGPRIHFVDETGGVDVEPEIALALFRIAQESMQNAQKHGGAGEIVVKLSGDARHPELEVRDDGVGFDPRAAEDDGSGGLGLASMRERARLVGARFEIRAANGRGTLVTVAVEPQGGRATGSSRS